MVGYWFNIDRVLCVRLDITKIVNVFPEYEGLLCMLLLSIKFLINYASKYGFLLCQNPVFIKGQLFGVIQTSFERFKEFVYNTPQGFINRT
jgi:hypothetical protein